MFELVRNVSLSLDVEASVAGLESLVNKLGSHPKARAALTKLNVRPTTARNGAARRPVARGNSSAPPATPSGSSDRQQSLARQNQKLKRELAQARGARSSASLGSETPVFFVVGLAKSGTSWLMRTLNGHPEILCQGEGRFFGGEWRRENFREWQKPVLVSSLFNALLSSEYLKHWIERSVWSKRDDPDEHIVKLTRLAVEHFLTEALTKTDKKIVGDKTPLLSPRFVEEIHLIYPEAKVIHIIRDGRDSAVSMIHHLWNRSSDRGGVQKVEPEELEKREAFRKNPQQVLETGEGIFTEERLRTVAESWRTRVGKTIEDGPTLLGSNYVEVRYEDLLERPHEEVGRLAAFLGADASDKAVEQAAASASFEKLSKGRERGEEDPGSFYRKGISGDWKNYFTERDREIFKEAAGDLLIKLGYEKDLSW
jgi:hypothetical protein